MRRTPEAEKARQVAIEISSAKKRRTTSKNRFSLNVKETNVTEKGETDVANAEIRQAAAEGDDASPNEDGE